jgi:small ligand-binding sensory domain FIST
MGDREKAGEIEASPALSLTVAHLPNVEVQPFYIEAAEMPDLDSSPSSWTELLGVEAAKIPNLSF